MNLVGVMGSMVLLICWRVVPAYRYISKLAINDIDGGESATRYYCFLAT